MSLGHIIYRLFFVLFTVLLLLSYFKYSCCRFIPHIVDSYFQKAAK